MLGLAALGGLVFTVGLVVRLRCAAGRCPTPQIRELFDLDAIGSLPRLFTTGLFLAVAVLSARAAARSDPPVRWWWVLVAVGGGVLAAAKVVSLHSAAEQLDGRWLTLVGGLGLTLVGLPLLWWAGRWWSVPAAGAVTFALVVYAAAALGLDQVTLLVGLARSGPVARAFATYLEEGGEAGTALLLLAAMARWLPPSSRRGA
ncbi:hypothetical protein [Modestobacter sp. DSM 44400]|uniref:hypothetical protein n=1 Tax=Modestobacter sp. DSM 44400 TaxID=1550230 RepID=UPI00111536AD|nr:hypothetical protein [Modestobacter sp. DSM 44400]